MALSSTSFKPGNQAGKRSRRRVAYDSIFSEALEQDGALFMEKIREHRDGDDKALSLKACDVFFKYARPPETIDEGQESPDTTILRERGLSLEQALEVREKIKAMHVLAIEEIIQEILSRDQVNRELS
jgi:hypothetical protein